MLVNCIQKLGKQIPADVREEIEALYDARIGQGLTVGDAGRSAVLAYHQSVLDEMNTLRVDAGLKAVTKEPVKEGAIVASETRPQGVAKLKEMRDTARREAETSAVTGLPNKAAFEKARPRLETDLNIELTTIDLNNFKAVNDKNSHIVGDQALKDAGNDLLTAAKAVSEQAQVFHLSGDEFAVASPTGTGQSIIEAADAVFSKRPYGDVKASISGHTAKTYADAEAGLQTAKAKRKGVNIAPAKTDVFDEEFSNLFGDETLTNLSRARSDAAAALKNTRAGLEEAGKGLLTMFDPKKFKTVGIPSFDEQTYREARPMFIQAVAHFKMAGQDTRAAIKSLLKYLKEELGASAEAIFNMKPYIVRFASELEKGEVKFEEPITPKAPETQVAKPETRQQPIARKSAVVNEDLDFGNVNKPNVPNLAKMFAARFTDGAGFKNIMEARAFAGKFLKTPVQPGSVAAKAVDEAIELAGVMRARDIIQDTQESAEKVFDQILRLAEIMPSLNVRTSQSIIEQAYSTPLPIAFVASELAGIKPGVSVYEPSAGNGALLIAADDGVGTLGNELNPERAANLKTVMPESLVSNQNALYKDLAPESRDVVITNPPFGVVQKDGRSVTYDVTPPNGQDFETNEIDHAIAFHALKFMKDRAVLIVGGVKADSDAARSDKYNAGAKRKFYYQLYKNYNVVGHFGLDGSLYSKQGASYPVDMIVIDGRGESKMDVPAANLPRQIKDWTQLKELLNEPDLLAADQRTGRDDSAELSGSRGDLDTEGAENGRPDVLELPGRQSAGNDNAVGRSRSDRSRDDVETDRSGLARERAGEDRDSIERVSEGEREPASVSDTGRSARDLAEENADEQPRRGVDAVDEGDGLGDVDRFRDGRGPQQLVRAAENALQVLYQPQSVATSVDTLLPVNLQEPVMRALETLEARVGSIDRYVEAKLDFPPGTFDKSPFLSAEQVDALGLAIWNLEAEKGFIIGDQTGVGKGRFVAGIIKYALLNNKTPIFVTEKPNLYADMYRDLVDIGLSPDELQILATNNSLRLPLDEDETVFLKTQAPDAHNTLLGSIISEGRLLEHNMLFTTYSQMQTVSGGKRTIRHDLLEALIPNAIIIFDESHNAGGQEKTTKDGEKKVNKEGMPILSRAEFARQLVGKASGAVYSSATYAKRPSVMSLYAATDMRLAVDSVDKLGPAIELGGVPLQQVVAGMLADAGQYIRREKSFDGIVFEKTSVPIARETATTITKVLKGIQVFDEFKQAALDELDKDAKAQGQDLSTDGSTGRAGAESTNFTSIMHNLIDQMLLTMKVGSTIERVIEAHKAGEKPVIALANTMGSFIEQYVKDFDMNPGDGLALDFSDVLMRYLIRSRDVVETDWEGNKVRRQLTEDELGEVAMKAYRKVEKAIQDADLSDIPLSPIDYMHAKLRENGIRSGEITGRQHTLNYPSTTPTEFKVKNSAGEVTGTKRHLTSTYEVRPQSLIKPQGRRKMINAFNNGQLDVLILNQAGSTGLSIHASPVFRERPIKARVMYILQAERNIDTFMQILGRVNRTGQQFKPRYELMTGNIPAENRPAAILMNKMAMLNANTTGNRKGKAKDESVTDFMNPYGDFVVAELMWDMSNVHRSLGKPLKVNDNGDGFVREGAARKVTGWIPLLPLEEQERIYNIIEQAYVDLIAQLDAMGENSLEAKKYDLQARTIETEVVREGFGSSPFSQAAVAEQVDIRKLGKPYTTEQVKALVLNRLGLEGRPSRGDVQHKGAEIVREMMDNAKADFETYEAEELEKVADKPDRLRAEQERLRVLKTNFHNSMHQHVVGGEYVLASMQGATYGVLVDVRRKGNTQNPLAFGDWELTFATTDASRQIKLNLRKLDYKKNDRPDLDLDELDRISTGKVLYRRVGKEAVAVQGKGYVDVYDAFDLGQQEARETRTMITGNLLAGYSQFTKGQIIFYTTEDGETKQGILMPKDFNLQKAVEAKPVIFHSEGEVLGFLERYPNRAVAKSEDGDMTLRFAYGQYTFAVPAPNKRGARYFKNVEILNAASPNQFIKSGGSMLLKVDDESIARAVVRAAGREGTQWQVTALKNEARQYVDDYRKSNAPKEAENPTPPLYHVRSAADADRLVSLRDTGDLGAVLPGVASVNHKTYIEISPEASEVIMSAYDDANASAGNNLPPEPATDGTMLEPDQTDLILTGLKKLEDLASARGYADKLNGVRELSQNIRKMAKRYKGAVALAVFEDTVPHETTHLYEFTGSVDKANPQGKARADRYDNPQQFADDADFKTVWNSLNALRGFDLDLGTALSEGLAYLATAEYEMLGLDKPRAVKLLVKMIKSYEKANGTDAVKNFNETGARLMLETLEQEGYEKHKTEKKNRGKKVGAGDESEGDGTDDEDGGSTPERPAQTGKSGRKSSERSAREEQASEPSDGRKLRSFPETMKRRGYDVESEEYDPQSHEETELKAEARERHYGSVADAVTAALVDTTVSAESMRILLRDIERKARFLEKLEDEGREEEADVVREEMAWLVSRTAENLTNIGRAEEIVKTLMPMSVEAAKVTAARLKQDASGTPDARLTKEEQKAIEELTKGNRELRSKLADAEKELEKLRPTKIELSNAQRVIDRLLKKLDEKKKKGGRKPGSRLYTREEKKVQEAIAVNFEGSLERLQKLLKGAKEPVHRVSNENPLYSIAKPTADEMNDLINVGANVLLKGLKEQEEYGRDDFYADMTAMLGKGVMPHLATIHAKSQIRLDQTRRQVRVASLRERYRAEEGNENLSDAEIDQIAAEDIAKRRAKQKIRGEHRKAAHVFESHEKLLNEIQTRTDEQEVAYAAALLKETKGKSINSVLNAIQDEYDVTPDEAQFIAQKAKALLVSMNVATKSAEEKQAESDVDDLNVRMRRAEMELSKFLSQLVRPQNLRERFSNDLRAKVVLNYGTQLFNVVQSALSFIPQQIVMDLANTAQHRAFAIAGRPRDVGELPPTRFKDSFLAYKYLWFNNKEVADGLLARFPDIYFQVKKGLMTDIELERKHAIEQGKNRASKALHRYFNWSDKVNAALARWTFAKTQEEWMRDALVVATLDQLVRAKHNRTLADILEKGHQGIITERQMQEAADRALTVTAAAPLDDPVGKSLKAASDWLDKHVTILFNPVWFARFTYTTTKAVANSLAWGALDATKGFGKGEYTTRSFAKGVMGWGLVGLSYAMLSAFGGGDDDDKWYNLYFFGKNNPPVDARRWFPISAYLFTAYVIKSLVEGRKAPRGMDWLEGIASFESDQYGKTPTTEFIKSIMGLEKDSESDAYGALAARELGVVLSGYFRFFSPFKTIYQQIDEEEAAYRKYGPGGLDQFAKEMAKTFPIQRLYGAEKRVNPVTGEPIVQPYPALKLVGVNLTAPGFIRARRTPATELAYEKFPSAKRDEEMSQEEKDSYAIRSKLTEAARLEKASLADIDKMIDRYVAEGKLKPKSGEYTKMVMRFTQLQDVIRRNFQITDPKDIAALGEVLQKASPEEVYQIREILLYKQDRVSGNADERDQKEKQYDSLLQVLTDKYARFKGGAFTESESVLMQATTPAEAIKRFRAAPTAEKPYLTVVLKKKKREFDDAGKEEIQNVLNEYRKSQK